METKAHSTMHLTDVSMHTLIEIALDRGNPRTGDRNGGPSGAPSHQGGQADPQRNVAKSFPSLRASVSASSKGQRSFWSPSRSRF